MAEAAMPKLRYGPFGPDRNCSDFATQLETQAFCKAAGEPEQDPHQLGSDGSVVVGELLL